MTDQKTKVSEINDSLRYIQFKDVLRPANRLFSNKNAGIALLTHVLAEKNKFFRSRS